MDLTMWLNLHSDPKAVAQGYGYRIHSQETEKHLRARGVRLEKEAQDWLTIAPAEQYERTTSLGRWEGLFTMAEWKPIPSFYLDRLRLADYLVVPSTWVRGLFESQAPEGLLPPIYVVPHGVSGSFIYHRRKFPKRGRPFRFMWCGSACDRKGSHVLTRVWANRGFNRNPRVELYLKTSATDGQVMSPPPGENVILDSRNLSRRGLVNLYHKAHAFIFPTLGEGFGFTLAEAMRTGLPCVATGSSGHMDYFDETVGYPVRRIHPMSGAVCLQMYDGSVRHHSVVLEQPSTSELAGQMWSVYENYSEALKRGRRASARIAEEFTWARTVDRLIEVVRAEQVRRGGRQAA